MAERQVSVGRQTMPLSSLFLVMATQNPIEQEGTYPLPEAQLDRFLMHVKIDYPDVTAERKILALARGEALEGQAPLPSNVISEQQIFDARSAVIKLHMAEAVDEYLVQLILATRTPQHYGDDLAGWLEFGASPRATIAIDRCARAHAWLAGREFVTPDDVQSIAHDCLRHRLILSYEAEAEGVTPDLVIDELLKRVPAA